MPNRKRERHEDILRELKIGSERIGFVDDLGKVAVLIPKQEVERGHRRMYDTKVHGLAQDGYAVLQTSPKKHTNGTRERWYDVFERL